MTEKISKIDEWDWPSRHMQRVGWEEEPVPELTIENIQFLAHKINELIDAINGPDHD